MLVLSAGLGDVLREVLKYHGLVENDYFHIISNFFKLNNNVVEGYGSKENGTYIHPFNKNGFGCLSYFKVRFCFTYISLLNYFSAFLRRFLFLESRMETQFNINGRFIR